MCCVSCIDASEAAAETLKIRTDLDCVAVEDDVVVVVVVVTVAMAVL